MGVRSRDRVKSSPSLLKLSCFCWLLACCRYSHLELSESFRQARQSYLSSAPVRQKSWNASTIAYSGNIISFHISFENERAKKNSTVGNTVLREVLSSQSSCESHATMPGHGICRVGTLVWAAQYGLGVPIFLSPPRKASTQS